MIPFTQILIEGQKAGLSSPSAPKGLGSHKTSEPQHTHNSRSVMGKIINSTPHTNFNLFQQSLVLQVPSCICLSKRSRKKGYKSLICESLEILLGPFLPSFPHLLPLIFHQALHKTFRSLFILLRTRNSLIKSKIFSGC